MSPFHMSDILVAIITRVAQNAHPNVIAPRGKYSQKNWVGVCDPLLRTLCMTKICDFPYPIDDPSKIWYPIYYCSCW